MFSPDFDSSYYKGPREFQLKHIHFHQGSEHTIKERRFDLEMHVVHKSANTQGGYDFAVTAVLFDTANFTAVLKAEEKKVLKEFFDCL